MSKSVTKDRQRSLAVHVNRGIMRFSFVSVGLARAFVSDVDTIPLTSSEGGLAGRASEVRGAGRRLSRPGTFDIDGCSSTRAGTGRLSPNA